MKVGQAWHWSVRLLRTLFFTYEGRRAMAFFSLLGGCVTMTLYAIAALTLVRLHAHYVFWLGIAAHVQVLVGLTLFGALFVRRTVEAGRDGVKIKDEAYADQAITIKAAVEVDAPVAGHTGAGVGSDPQL